MNTKNSDVLKEISSKIHNDILKPIGFKKRRNTFNRVVDKDLIQVINLQAGQYPIGNYVLPGYRESKYGTFTINLGIFIPEIDVSEKNRNNSFINEYNCNIRARLGTLIDGKDKWWKIKRNMLFIWSIENKIEKYGLRFLDDFSSRDKILHNRHLYYGKSNSDTREKLDNSLIYRNRGEYDEFIKFFKEHYDESVDHIGHQEYLLRLASELGIRDKI